MSIVFREEGHAYESLDPNEAIQWTSVTSLVGLFKPKFDTYDVSQKCSKNKKSKWYGIEAPVIRDIWASETARAVKLGTFYHNQRESDLLSHDTLTKEGVDLPIIQIKIQDGVKYAPSQKLISGIYPEHMVYLKSAEICGQADYVEVLNGTVNIMDYKTNKEIKQTSFENWEGIKSMMNQPLGHIEDCNLMHYTLQMSIYMYIILKHNPRLKPGKMVLQHVVFEREGLDQFGYPIIKYSDNGDPVIKDIISYTVPYLKEEVLTMINWLKDNKQ